jgi:hypothetical protein
LDAHTTCTPTAGLPFQGTNRSHLLVKKILQCRRRSRLRPRSRLRLLRPPLPAAGSHLVPVPPLSYFVLALSHAATAAALTRRLLVPPLAVQRRRSLLPSCVAEQDKEGCQRLCILNSRRSRAELRFLAPPRAIRNGSGSKVLRRRSRSVTRCLVELLQEPEPEPLQEPCRACCHLTFSLLRDLTGDTRRRRPERQSPLNPSRCTPPRSAPLPSHPPLFPDGRADEAAEPARRRAPYTP